MDDGGGNQDAIPLFLVWAVIAAGTVAAAAIKVDGIVQLLLVFAVVFLLISFEGQCRRGPWRLFYIGCIVFMYLRYFLWRTTESLIYYDFFSFLGALALYGAELYAVSIGLLSAFASIQPIDRRPVPLPQTPEALPTVDIFIPTYNEPPELLEVTLLAALQVRYPRSRLKVYLLDDGGTDQKRADPDPEKAQAARERHETLKRLCAEAGAHYLTRPRNLNAKAGNVNAALARTDGELILVLDADHVPTVDILERTVGYFLEDPRLFLVQTPHFFINLDPVEKNLGVFGRMPAESEMFFRVIERGLDFWNATLFAGSAALLRRSHLMANGGVATSTITEDAETALALHARGLNSAYVARPMISGLAPETFSGFIRQRMRWAQGMIQILLLKNPLTHPGLSIPQRLCYLSSCLYWFFPFASVIFLLAPTLFIFFGLKIYAATPLEIVAYTLPQYWLALRISHFLYGSVRWPFVSQLYEILQSMFSLIAIWETIRNPRAPRFQVTPKGERLDEDFVSPLAWPFYVVLALLALGYPAALLRYYTMVHDRHVIWVVLAWHTLNFLVALAALGALMERRQRRSQPRVGVSLAGELVADGRVVPCPPRTCRREEPASLFREPPPVTPGSRGAGSCAWTIPPWAVAARSPWSCTTGFAGVASRCWGCASSPSALPRSPRW